MKGAGVQGHEAAGHDGSPLDGTRANNGVVDEDAGDETDRTLVGIDAPAGEADGRLMGFQVGVAVGVGG